MSDKDMSIVPYPSDTRAKGWRFELDHERIRQSDTWALAPDELRPWLLMLWMVAWEQTPCASLPDDDTLIAARIGMLPKAFAKARAVLLRGWWKAADNRLYHDVMCERVAAMLAKREKDQKRAAANRAKSAAHPHGVPSASRVTSAESEASSAPSTKHLPSEAIASGTAVPQAQDSADVIFGLGLPLLTAANVADRNARSMLGLMRKTHGDQAVIGALQRCAEEKPLQPVAWLQAALKTHAKPANRQISIEAENKRVAAEWAAQGVTQ